MRWLDRLKSDMRIHDINPEMATERERWCDMVKNDDTTVIDTSHIQCMRLMTQRKHNFIMNAMNQLFFISSASTFTFTLFYGNGHNLFVQPASSRLFVRIYGVH